MKKILYFLVGITCFINANARHLKGGWIQYQYLSHNNADNTNKYRVTVKQYLEVYSAGAQIDASVSLGIFDATTAALLSVVNINLSTDSNIKKSVYPPCIVNPPLTGYKIDTYITDINLPQSSTGYILSVQRCCRASDIVNVNNADSVGFTYTATIPGIIAGVNYFGNTSPYFLANDTAVVCAKNGFNLLLNAIDADGDSLSYAFCDGLNGANITNPKPNPPSGPPYFAIPYKSPFSGSNPLGSLVTIDNKTGLISGIAPDIIGDYVVSVCVAEYRNGILIGVTKKEIHIEVADCELAAALLDSAYTSCNSYTMSFTNKAIYASVNSYQWDFGVKGINTDTSSAANPTYSYPDTGTYTVKLKVTASGGCKDSAVSTVKIYPVFSPHIMVKSSCYLIPVYFSDTMMNHYVSLPLYHWLIDNAYSSNLPNPSYLYANAGIYTAQLFVKNGVCISDTITTVFSLPNTTTQSCNIIKNSIDTILSGDTVTFTAVPLNAGNMPVYQWMKNGVNISGATSSIFISNTLQHNDTITCKVTSNDTCVVNKSVLSNSIVISVLPASVISGNFVSVKEHLIKNVMMNVNGLFTLKPTGEYSLKVANGSNYVLKPTKNNDVKKNNGVTAIDIILTQRHILNTTKLNSAYKIIAADVNNDKTVSNIDVIFMKRLILGIDTTFKGNRLWAFVDSAYNFPDTTNPFPYKDSMNYINLAAAKNNQSFIGVKLGDVNYDWNPALARSAAMKSLELKYHVISLRRGGEKSNSTDFSGTNLRNDGIIKIPITVKNFKDLTALQYTLDFNNSKYEFVAIENNKLGIEFNEQQAMRNGSISFLWADAKGEEKTLEDGSEIFTLMLRPKELRIEEVINNLQLTINNSITEIEAWDKDNQQHHITLTKQTTQQEPKTPNTKQWVVSPNPNDGNILVSLSSNANKTIVFEVSNTVGKPLYTQSVEAVKGSNVYHLNLNKNAKLPMGVYFIKAIGLEGENVKRIVVSGK